ncbi:MFS transporter [Sinorhizobium meliloti]|uniref:cyclophilin-like fold protein n=1 Tax=Rhizobium meliloti TaxID=382 RepID=UPI000FD6E6B7|nr:cyclophilin-like fold protein [Sinorhizobium meliloti]RVP11010.1 MFS transporter [Sinorhizobium meliloti]
MSDRRHLMKRRTLLAGAAVLALPGLEVTQTDPNNQEPTDVKIKLTFGDHAMAATLYDNPSARDFASMLPLDLKIEDFGSNEKIAYLPRKLTVEGSGPFSNERPYDLCYYMPWGNLAMFYADYKHPGLVRLGRFEDGYEALHVPGEFPLRIERIQ